MLRGTQSVPTRLVAVGLVMLLGALAALLVALGNPGNMGLCGACFVRDLAGALRLHQGPAILRPEVPGIALGALLWALASRRHVGRSGSLAVARFLLCVAMAIGSLVFLGCPFRLLQRLGGGDIWAWAALPGFLVGVALAQVFERRGYTLGKTQEVPRAVGLLGPAVFAALLGSYLWGFDFAGPGWRSVGPSGPAHAPGAWALGIAAVAGILLSATGFCAVSAVRSIFSGSRWMALAAAAFVLGYAGLALWGGRFAPEMPPVAHGDWLWNTLALVLVGLCGAFAGGCPVRQIVMAGEGNGDAFVGCAGLLVGGALAHSLGLASAPASAAQAGGPTDAGRVTVVALLVVVLVYAAAMSRAGKSTT
jgi:YedE family putative selenium metabolism protein